jgi:hypothetical protein
VKSLVLPIRTTASSSTARTRCQSHVEPEAECRSQHPVEQRWLECLGAQRAAADPGQRRRFVLGRRRPSRERGTVKLAKP